LKVFEEDGSRIRPRNYTPPRSDQKFSATSTFDAIKNKLGEKKAWATSLEAKKAQAQFIALTHNLLLLYDQRLENEHGVTNQAEDQRRQKRMDTAVPACRKTGHALSTLLVEAQNATQRSVKFIRWVRQSIRAHATEAIAVLRLRGLYATL